MTEHASKILPEHVQTLATFLHSYFMVPGVPPRPSPNLVGEFLWVRLGGLGQPVSWTLIGSAHAQSLLACMRFEKLGHE